MAVQSTPKNSQIVLRLLVGNDQFTTKTINNIKPTASDEDVYAVAVALASLQSLPLVNVYRENDEELIEV